MESASAASSMAMAPPPLMSASWIRSEVAVMQVLAALDGRRVQHGHPLGHAQQGVGQRRVVVAVGRPELLERGGLIDGRDGEQHTEERADVRAAVLQPNCGRRVQAGGLPRPASPCGFQGTEEPSMGRLGSRRLGRGSGGPTMRTKVGDRSCGAMRSPTSTEATAPPADAVPAVGAAQATVRTKGDRSAAAAMPWRKFTSNTFVSGPGGR